MFYFPKTEDTKDLKTLIKEGIISYKGKNEDVKGEKKAFVRYKGKDVRDDMLLSGHRCRSYDFEYTSKHITFDKNNIYVKGEQVSLNELLESLVFRKDRLTDEVKRIIEARGYELSPVVMGYTEALEYMGESFDSKDYEIPSYEVVKQREIGEKDVDEPVKTEVHPTQSIFDIKAAAEAELANTKNEQTPVKENEYCR